MLRQRIVDRPVMVRDVIRKTAGVKDIEELLARFDALATPWTPPPRYADLAPASIVAQAGY